MKPDKIYHCTTPRKVQRYKETGHICNPVRGFDTEKAAMAWCIKTGRTVILELSGWSTDNIHKLPDHHNSYGTAFWVDENIPGYEVVFTVERNS